MKKPRSTRAQSNKRLFLIFAFILLALLTAITIFSLTKSSKMKAGEYLRVTHTKSIGEFFNNRKNVKITELGLNITAVMGDAHSIIIIVDTQADVSNDVYKFIGKGETLSISVKLNGYVTGLNAEGKFPIEVGISCSEASPDEITIFIDPIDIVAP